MTRPILAFLSTAAAAAFLVFAGCDAPPPRTSGATAVSPSGSSLQSDTSIDAARDVVQAFIWERTEEGAPYFIEANATEFDRIEKRVARRDDEVVCRAVFRSDESEFLLEFTLEREMQAYAITRIVLKAVDREPAERVLFDRAALVR